LGEAALFSWDDLVRRAKEMAQQPFVARPPVAPRTVAEIEYKLHQQISQPVGQGLYALGPGECPVTFFHLGRLFPKPVRIHALVDGVAREVLYSKDVFHYPAGHPAEQMPEGAGFAGFRIHDPWDPAHQREPGDWLAFLGASYFRTRGDLHQYGISARGIAINAANPEPPFTEEFPSFRAFWIEPVRNGRGRIFAFLDGPSITGAYRFEITREPTITMDVTCALNLRRDVVRFGIAPLTSMFFYGKINRFIGGDWRPAVHDSEGLAIWNGRGEQMWRPLNNPPRVTVSTFEDENPKGFGLLQRERAFDAFQDGGRNFERRPHLWVQPLGPWGRGSVQLLEMPTRSEFEDNIGAFWVPNEPARSGMSHEFRYRLHWSAGEHFPPGLARCIGTRMANPWNTDVPGYTQARHVVLDFEGDALSQLDVKTCRMDVTFGTGGGLIEHSLEPHPSGMPTRWRTLLTVGTRGSEPVKARLVLRSGDRSVSETWLAQLYPLV